MDSADGVAKVVQDDLPAARRRPPRPRDARPGSTTRAILDAARDSFLTRGFSRTTIRGVAEAAGVDPSLVYYYFGSKANLFGAAVDHRSGPGEDIARAVSDDAHTAGPRLVRLTLTAWDDTENSAAFHSLLRWMAIDGSPPDEIRAHAVEQVTDPVERGLLASGANPTEARERAALAGSHLVGLAVFRYLLRIEPLVGADVERLADIVGPTVQGYLTGPLPPPSRHDPGVPGLTPAPSPDR